MNILERIHSKYSIWKDKRLLKKYGSTTWKEYSDKFDPDVNRYAHTTSEFYSNYSYVYVFKDTKSEIFKEATDWIEGYTKINDWCDNNCKGKWRADVHRVLLGNFFTDPNGVDTTNNYILNHIGGYDYLFFAFMNEEDYIWFVTRWS